MFDRDEDELDDEYTMSGLHWMAAGLFMAAGAEAALGQRRGDHRAPDAIRWAPMIAAPLAGAAHAARALWPTPTTRALARVADGLAIGVGTAGLATSLLAAQQSDHDEETRNWTDRVPGLAPLAFAAIGILGLIVQEEEEAADEEMDALERRASIVERLVPKRRARLDRIVVHV